MSFINAKIVDEDRTKLSKETIDLYRMRDNDIDAKKYKINYYQPLGGKIENSLVLSLFRFTALQHTDENWAKLTEEERIENGLPTKFLLFHKSPLSLFLGTLIIGISFHNLRWKHCTVE